MGLEWRVRELVAEFRRVMRERDILKHAEHFRPGRVRNVYAGSDQIVLSERFAASAVWISWRCVAFPTRRVRLYVARCPAAGSRSL